MVELDNPIVILDEYLAYIKLCHVLGGIYIWEFVTTLDYEWDVIQGRRPYRRTIWIYSFTRLSSLLAVIIIFLGLDTERPINCQLWITFTFIFGCLSISAALLLIVLRTIAIWNKNKIIIVLSTGIWVTYLGFVVQAISQLRSSWSGGHCNLPNMERDKIAFIFLVATDLILVSIMFAGLLRLRSRTFGIGNILWKQGIIWILFATGAGLFDVVFIWLDLSPILNIMFVMPVLISMSITATRLYTSLTDFSSSPDIVDLDRGCRAIANTSAKGMPAVHVHMTHEEFPTVITPSASPCFDIRIQPCDKPQMLGLNDDLECSMEK